MNQRQEDGISVQNNEENTYIVQQLPQLPPTIKGLVYGDIPIKFIKKNNFLPFQSLNVDATPQIFMQCLKVCKETNPDNISLWERNLTEIFVPTTGKHPYESALVSLSVRSTFDLYF